MVEATLGRALKDKGIKQYELRDVLAEKYDCDIDISMINKYCLAHGYRDTGNWKIIRECVKKEYGIVQLGGQWLGGESK